MKLLFMIVRDIDADNVLQGLVDNKYRVTRVASTGGFLRHGNVTLMSGVEDAQVDQVIGLLKEVCCPSDETGHSVTIFVVDMPFYEQI